MFQTALVVRLWLGRRSDAANDGIGLEYPVNAMFVGPLARRD